MRMNSVAATAASMVILASDFAAAAPLTAPTWRIRTAADMNQTANRRVWIEGTCPTGACEDGKFRVKGGCGHTMMNSLKGYVFEGWAIDTALLKGERLMTTGYLQPNYIALATGISPSADAWYVSVYPDGRTIWPENFNNEVRQSACQFNVINTENNVTVPLSIILN